jgi:hypothetical protein
MAIKVNRARGYVDFCTDLGLRTQWETAQEALLEARKAGGDMLVDAASTDAATAVQALEKKMQGAILRFELEALPRKHWQELGIRHPAREGVAADARMNVDTSIFFDSVVMGVDEDDLKTASSIIGVTKLSTNKVVDFDPKTEWVPLADDMSDGQYNEFVEKLLELNRGTGSNVPFSRLASVVTQGSAKK